MIKVVCQGLGEIGQETARLILRDPTLEVIGAVDPKYKGENFGDVLGVCTENKIKIGDDAESLFKISSLKKLKPDAVVLATCSKLEELLPSLETAIRNGVNVVSPSEELFYPQFGHEKEAVYLDGLAKNFGVSLLGRGVNPGCLMDVYPLSIVRERNITDFDNFSMRIYRWSDSTERRESLKMKTGVGLSEDEFNRLSRENKIGHVGLISSAVYLADGLGFTRYEIEFDRKPVVSFEEGKVLGLRESCAVSIEGKRKIDLDLRICIGASNKNLIGISLGDSLKTIDYGGIVNGDIATARILKNAIGYVVNGPYGLNRINYAPNPCFLLKK